MGITAADFFIVIATAAIADNIVLAKMLGLCPFIGLSKRLNVAVGIGVATTAVLTAACMMSWGVDKLLPPSLLVLRPLVFIAIVAAVVQAVEMLVRLYAPLLHRHLGVFLPLIATNCAVLGVMLIALREHGDSFVRTTATGLGGGLGFLAAVVCMALLRRRVVEANVPIAFRGAPLAVLSAGFMALAFSGLSAVFN